MFRSICSVWLLATVASFAEDITTYHKKQIGAVKFNKYGIADIVTGEGWVAINRRKKVLYKPFVYDNGPDYIQEGLRRYVENGKVGFVDERGRKRIAARYDFVSPFQAGKAKFCNGCKKIVEGEHVRYDETSGIWGIIDTQGRQTVGR